MFFVGSQEGPQVAETVASNKSITINMLEGRPKKSATFDPPNPRLTNKDYEPMFAVLKLPKLDLWVEDLGGSNVADFLGHPSNMFIVIDLLLATVSATWGPSCDPTKNIRKCLIYASKNHKWDFFDPERRKSGRRGPGRCRTTLGW